MNLGSDEYDSERFSIRLLLSYPNGSLSSALSGSRHLVMTGLVSFAELHEFSAEHVQSGFVSSLPW
jgi:hypothetical protein